VTFYKGGQMFKKKRYFLVTGLEPLEKMKYKFSWDSPMGEYIRIHPIKGLAQLVKQFMWFKYSQIFLGINKYQYKNK